MASPTNKLLVLGAALSGLAALMHLACLAVGAPLFRLLGAGEQMAQLYLAGHWYPTVVTLVIAGVLAAWSAYALSGAERLASAVSEGVRRTRSCMKAPGNGTRVKVLLER